MNIDYVRATKSDFTELANLRLESMRESLEYIGRYNPERSIERFRKSFTPESTYKIIVNGQFIGFYSLAEHNEYLSLDHLYILPSFQDSGIGSTVLKKLTRFADQKALPITLGALKQSRSNDFYKRHGFKVSKIEEWDVYYSRPPRNSDFD